MVKHLPISVSAQQTQKHLYTICTMLDQRRRRWADVVQMLYKCFVSAGGGQNLTCVDARF